MIDLLQTHLKARVVGFLTGASVQRLSACNAASRIAYTSPAVLRDLHLTCSTCGTEFVAADNAPGSCRYHPRPVQEVHDSQGGTLTAFHCCDTQYMGERWYTAEPYDEAKAMAVRESPGCVEERHYVAPARSRPFSEGDVVEVLLVSRKRFMCWGASRVLPDVPSETTHWVLGVVQANEVASRNNTRWISPYEQHNRTSDVNDTEARRYDVETELGVVRGARPYRVRWPSVAPQVRVSLAGGQDARENEVGAGRREGE